MAETSLKWTVEPRRRLAAPDRVPYLFKLMDNPRIMRYLQANFPEILEEFGKIVEQTSIEG